MAITFIHRPVVGLESHEKSTGHSKPVAVFRLLCLIHGIQVGRSFLPFLSAGRVWPELRARSQVLAEHLSTRSFGHGGFF